VLSAWPSLTGESGNIPFYSQGKAFKGSPLSQPRDFQMCQCWDLGGDQCLNMVQGREERPVWMGGVTQLQWCSAGGAATSPGHQTAIAVLPSSGAVLLGTSAWG